MPLRVRRNLLTAKALILVISVFVFVARAGYGSSETGLALALYEEGDWRLARLEALRSLRASPESVWSRALVSLAIVQVNPQDGEAAEAVRQLILQSDDPAFRAWAAYELGRLRWGVGDRESAFCLLQITFYEAVEQPLFLQAAFSLQHLLWQQSDLIARGAPLRAQLVSVQPLISPAIREAAPPLQAAKRGIPWGGGPAYWLVRMYQTQISPAIGQRCAMHPSCSAYCVEASARYGWLGVPMTADRLIREPDHVAGRLDPIEMNGEIRFYDPVSAHSAWFRRYQ